MILLADIRRDYDFEVCHDGKHKYIAIDKETGHKVRFGAIGYEHYKDRLRHYASWDHKDKVRRENFQNRFRRFKDAKGTAGWFAYHVLW